MTDDYSGDLTCDFGGTLTLALLDGVRQFVSEQALAFAVVRGVLARGEVDVLAGGEGGGVDGFGRGGSGSVGVDEYAAEVGIEAGLHEVAGVVVERLAAAVVGNDLGRRGRTLRGGGGSGLALDLLILFLGALGALPLKELADGPIADTALQS
jgi:hypothetical protein